MPCHRVINPALCQSANLYCCSHEEASFYTTCKKPSNDVLNLRKLLDQAESSVRNTKSLKVETNLYRQLQVPLLKEKLPNDLTLRIACEIENDVWLLDDMLGILKKEVERQERSILVRKSLLIKINRVNMITQVLHCLVLKIEQIKSHVFCGLLNHKSIKCLKVSNPAARKEICKKSTLCFICFDKNHNASASTWDYKWLTQYCKLYF